MYIEQLAFTRFLAAALIVIYHFGTNVIPFNQYHLNVLVSDGRIYVSYFLALSGFILAYIYYNENEKICLKHFYISRFARIYPIYFLSLIPFIFLFIREGNFDFGSFLIHIFLLQSFFPTQSTFFNIPSWAISVLAVFYVIFPLLMKYIYRFRKKSFLCFSITIWVLSQILYLYLWNNIDNFQAISSYRLRYIIRTNPFFHLNTFLLGCAVGVYFKGFTPKQHITNYLNTLILLLSVFSIMVLLLMKEHISNVIGINFKLSNGLLAPFFLLCIFSLCMDNSFLKKIFKNKLFVTLGEASYCIYLFQVPYFHYYLYFSGEKEVIYYSPEFYINLMALIAISIFSYKYIELPFRNKIRKFLLIK